LESTITAKLASAGTVTHAQAGSILQVAISWAISSYSGCWFKKPGPE